MNKIKSFAEYLCKDKKRLVILLAALFGLILMLFGSGGDSGGSDESATLSEYKSSLEEELSELCSSIDGAGKCRVTVSFSEGESVSYHGSNVSSTTPPKVLGVTVVSEGGDKIEVKRAISECMTALFDIGSNRVCVLKAD